MELEVEPPPDAEEDAGSYHTGSDYPAADDEDGGEAPAYSGDDDIYGEDDPFPDDELGEVPASARTGEVRKADVTRIGAVVTEDDEAGEDEPDLDDANATRAGPPIHVEVISGPDQGKTRRFRGVRMVIGRTQGCDFKLADGSVSRRHLELVLGDAGVLLRDLGSGNGTRVNGEKVNEKLLEDGDEIAIGQTRFRFVDEVEALRKREEERKAAEEAARKAEEEAEAQAAAAAGAEGGGAEGGEGAAADEGEALEESSGRRRRRRSRAAASDKDLATATNLPGLPSRRAQLKARGGRAGLSALPPGQKKLLLIGGAVLALLVVVGLGFRLRTPPPPPPNPRAEQAALKLQQARQAVLDQRFEEAVALAEAAEKLLPGSDASGLGASARKELAAQRGLEEVRALIREREFGAAAEKLATVQLAVVLGEQERQKVRGELEAAVVADARERAIAALDALDAATAEKIITQELPRSEALSLAARLDEVKAEAARREAELAKQQKAEAAAAHRRAQARRAAYVDEAFSGVQRKFHAGEFQRAVLECDHVIDQHRGDEGIRSRARELKRLIPLFARYFEEGQRKYRANNLGGASRPLRKARETYRKIDFQGALGQIIDEQLAGASLVAGRAALSRNDLATAVREFKDALELNPSESRAREGIETAQRKAEELYLEGYMIRDRDPRGAASRFRIVMDVMPKDSPLYEKAENQLNSMGP